MAGTILWQAWLRTRWRSVVVLVVLLGLGTGLGLAALAGARRTASSYGRVLDVIAAPDVVSGHGMPADVAVERAAQVRGVRVASTDIGFTGFIEGQDPVLVPYYIGAYDNPYTAELPLIVDGRRARLDRSDEILISVDAARSAGFQIGDEITIGLFTPTFEVESEQFTIVGTERSSIIGDAAVARNIVRFTPAFTGAHLDLQAWSRTTFIASDPDEMLADLVAKGYPIDETRVTDHSSTQDAVRPAVLTLAVIGAIALIAAGLVTLQALARELQLRRADDRVLRGLGVLRADLRTADSLILATVLVPGLVLGALLAVAFSPLAPVGRVRTLEPAPGIDVDWTVIGLGCAALALVIVAGLLTRRRRDVDPAVGSVTAPGIALRAHPVASAGLHLAIGSTRSVRRTYWTTFLVTALAIVLIVGGVTFISSLDRLTGDPARYGFGWDLATRNAFGQVPPEALIEQFGEDEDIEGIAAGSVRNIVINGSHAVPGLALVPVTDSFWPTLAAGRLPRAPDEALVGRETLDAIDADIGDTITIAADARSTSITTEVEIVGQAVFAPIELAGFDPPRLDVGIALDLALVASLDPEGEDAIFERSSLPDQVYFDLKDGVEAAEIVERYPQGIPDQLGVPTEWLLSVAPAEVIESNRALPLLWGAITPLALIVLATVAHAQLSLVRRRQRDYAVLKALGFTRGQVRATVAWQATATVLLPIFVAIPVGIAAGRSGWSAFARLIGVIDAPVVPVLAVAACGALALLLVNAVCLGPAGVAARVDPAVTLRSD
jgi:ABC-type lipoprotein release transport system permease subunit